MAPRGTWRVTTAPTVEPVTTATAKTELGIPSSDTSQDARIERLIKAARSLAESYTNRAFISQEITYDLDRFPSSSEPEPWWSGVQQAARSVLTRTSSEALSLPRPPYLSGLTVTYTTSDGDTIVMNPATDLLIDTTSEPARVVPIAGAWPQTRAQLGVHITYSAGYGSNPSDVPAAITEAILAHVIDAYARPNASITSESIDNASVAYGSTAGPRPTPGIGLRGDAQAMLEPYRIKDSGLLRSPYAIP